MLTKERISDFKKRIKAVKKLNNEIIAFVEIKLTNKQLEVISAPLLGMDFAELEDYYRTKIHGELCLVESEYVTREDVSDFQYLIDLGVLALENGFDEDSISERKTEVKTQTEAEFIDQMINWIDKRFNETHSEIILKSENRNYVIVPNNRENQKTTEQ